jgi:hypothetical protein
MITSLAVRMPYYRFTDDAKELILRLGGEGLTLVRFEL